jgi:RecJ-like exonuclease
MRKPCPVCDGKGYENERNSWGVVESKHCYYCVGAGWLEVLTSEQEADEYIRTNKKEVLCNEN